MSLFPEASRQNQSTPGRTDMIEMRSSSSLNTRIACYWLIDVHRCDRQILILIEDYLIHPGSTLFEGLVHADRHSSSAPVADQTGLYLHAGKTKVLNFSSCSDLEMKRCLEDIPMVGSFVISRSGVYLGLPLVVDAIGKEFDVAMLKYHARCLHICTIAGHTSERMRAHQIFAVSVLMFLAQLIDLPRRAGTVEAATLASILVAPMHAVTASSLSACVAGSRWVRYTPIDIQCRAALLRFALVTDELDECGDLRRARDSDDALILPRSPIGSAEGYCSGYFVYDALHYIFLQQFVQEFSHNRI